MARGTTFLELVTMLRAELRRSSSVAVGVDDQTSLKYELNKAYERLFDEHDWAHLRKTFAKIPLSAGQQHYNLPSDLNYEQIESVGVWWGGTYYRLKHGIGPDDYNTFDSTEDVRSSPPQKWDIRWTGSAVQIEVWPLPVDNDAELQVMGLRKIVRMVNNSDVCLLDDYAVVMSAAITLTKDIRERSAKKTEFAERLIQIKANSHAAHDPTYLNTNPEPSQKFANVTVRVS